MAQETVVTESFSERLAEAGEDILRRLDKAGLEIRAALWLYLPDARRWSFVVATPYVKLDGPRKVYKKIQSVLSRVPNEQRVIDLQSVTAVDTTEPLIGLLRTAIQTGDGISGIRFSRNMINGVLIEDAYIYRLT